MNRRSRIMVTGANGYIGGNFIEKYKNEYRINPVSLSSGDNLDFSNVTTVVHLSALVHQCKKLPYEQYFSVNTWQTLTFAEKAKRSGVKHFVFYSTVMVYGSHGYLKGQSELLNERSICHPKTAYGISKLVAEKLLLNLEDEQFIVSIIRPPMVYGKDSKRGNMERLKKLVKLFPVLPFNYSDNKRSMVHINNLLHFTKCVVDKQISGIFIPQDKDTYSIKKIVKAISISFYKRTVLIRFPKIVFLFLVKMKPQMMASLYGSLGFDSTISNKKLNYRAKETSGF